MKLKGSLKRPGGSGLGKETKTFVINKILNEENSNVSFDSEESSLTIEHTFEQPINIPDGKLTDMTLKINGQIAQDSWFDEENDCICTEWDSGEFTLYIDAGEFSGVYIWEQFADASKPIELTLELSYTTYEQIDPEHMTSKTAIGFYCNEGDEVVRKIIPEVMLDIKDRTETYNGVYGRVFIDQDNKLRTIEHHKAGYIYNTQNKLSFLDSLNVGETKSLTLRLKDFPMSNENVGGVRLELEMADGEILPCIASVDNREQTANGLCVSSQGHLYSVLVKNDAENANAIVTRLL